MERRLDAYSRRIAAAQADDGYLNTYVQSGQRASRYERLAWDHEIFNNGALIQSAVAQVRATGRTELLAVAVAAADHLDRTFGPGPDQRARTCGHPVAEMALVELYRTTRERRYLELARYFVDVRGHDLLEPTHAFGDAYHSDRIPVRSTLVPEGHAVRAIYLAAGATDVAVETGDASLLAALERQFYNAVLPGVSLDGSAYFYANALQLRAGTVATDTRMAAAGRQPWFGCSCCPTNLMRTFASLHGYLATSSGGGVELHQYASAAVRSGEVALAVSTDYPWNGRVAVTVEESPSASWTLRLRIPAWAAGATVRVGEEIFGVEPGAYASVRRTWRPGETLVLDLPMAPRFTAGHPRVDSARGCVAIERGPLVYAVEQVDQEDGVLVDDLAVDPAALEEEYAPDVLGGVPVAIARDAGRPVRAIPYFLWANRELGPMRVWLPIGAITA